MNRKFFLIFSSFVIHISISFSQGIKLGFEINSGLSWMKENSTTFDNQFAKFSIDGGLALENYFTNNYAIYSGIKLASLNYKLLFLENSSLIVDGNTQIINKGEKVNLNLQYLNIPLGIKMKTNRIGYSSYYVNLGLNSYMNIKSEASSSIFNNVSISKEINFLNISYYFLLGFEYNIVGETNLIFGIKYNNGFIDVLTKKSSHETIKQLVFSTGIMF